MTVSRWKVDVVVLAAAAVLLLQRARVGMSCGPFFEHPIFTFRTHPDFPFEEFARGRLGIVQPTYSPLYLFIAYRNLVGTGFNSREVKALFPAPAQNPPAEQARLAEWGPLGEPSVLEWFDVRKLVPGVGPPSKVRVYKWLALEEGKNIFYGQFLNCTRDAFETAAATLRHRIETFGATSTEVRDWVEAQDRVFANCSGGLEGPWVARQGAASAPPAPVIPVAASTTAPAVLRADRAYQIAAANFYAGNYEDARKMFEAIARDPSSPWGELAPYLAARTLVRKATVTPTTNSINRDVLAEAETRLRKIIADPKLRQVHPASERLLSYVQIRLHPEDRLHELAGAVLRANSEGSLAQDIVDYRYLLRKISADSFRSGTREQNRIAVSRDDLTDWITIFRDEDLRTLEISLEKWRTTQSPAWLVAALTKVAPGHPAVAELLKAAEAVGKGSPAFPSVSYHATRLLVQSGQAENGKARLDYLIAQGHSIFPDSSMNLLLALRMTLARNLGEFLKYAPRVPAGTSLEFSDIENAEWPKNGGALFDQDAASVLNMQMPLTSLKQVAETNSLPANQRREIALAAWARAVLLDDSQMARGLVPTVAALVPDLKNDLERYSSPQEASARRFAAAFLMLRFPGVQPYVVGGRRRETPPGRIDNFRENWWAVGAPCGLNVYWNTHGNPTANAPETKMGPIFLSEPEKGAGEAEWKELLKVGVGPDYLSAVVIEWAKRHPDDPRVPEALYRAVRSTRVGCTDGRTQEFSRAAFQILHRRYAATPWALMTKYWYK